MPATPLTAAAEKNKCLSHLLLIPGQPKCRTLPNVMEIGEKILCRHINNKEEKTDEYYKDLNKQLKFFVGCTGCNVGKVFGLEDPLETLGLAEPIHNVLCHMLSPLFASDCAKRLIGDDVSKVTTNVKKMLCEKEEDLDVKLTMETMKDGGCMADNVAGTDDALANLTEDAGKALAPAVRNAVRTMKKKPIFRGLFKSLFCMARELVDDILNGGEGGLNGLLGGGGNGGGVSLFGRMR